jgi:hypothetical protein
VGGEWSASRPGRALAPGKVPPVPIVQEAGWTSEPVWTQKLQEKSFHLCRGSNLDRPVVQSVARRYKLCERLHKFIDNKVIATQKLNSDHTHSLKIDLSCALQWWYI